MKRSLEQNDIFHVWCREISKHLTAGGAPTSEYMVKHIILYTLGNGVVRMGVRIPMRSSKYKHTDSDLTEKDRKAGFISMDELLNRIDAWASTDLGLILDPATRAMIEDAV